MKFELHPNAAKNFNEKADILLSEFVPYPSKSFNIDKDSFRPNYFISASLGEKENRIKDYFRHNGQLIGLRDKESYKKIDQLAGELQRAESLHERVSQDVLAELILEWMKYKFKTITYLSMVDYVLSKIEINIQDLEIWIPIADLYIQSEIKIGRITLKPITKEMFEHWRTVAMKEFSVDNDKIQMLLDEEQKIIQGLAAATMKVNAEPNRAFEIVLEETEKSIGLLRFFSPSNFYPEITSHCTVLGKENFESTNHFILKDDNLFIICKGHVDKNIQPWKIDDAKLSMFQQNGLDIMSELLVREKRTKFQEKLIDSLLLYSRSSLMNDLSDKLVYIFVALESFLLRSDNESIQNSIGDIMAYFISSEMQERVSIVTNVKKAYKLRSKFVHHGKTIEDLETLTEFMRNALRFFNQLIQNSNRFDTVEQFFKAIESEKYS